MYTKQW